MIIKVESKLALRLGFDRRFKHWGKLIRTAADLDLTKPKGFALAGPFVKWGESCPIHDGQLLVLASEQGSVAHHDYDYALVQCIGGSVAECPWADVLTGVRDSDLPDEVKAAAENNKLYCYAAFASLRLAPALVSNP